MNNAIEIINLTKSYGKHRGVENISFNVPQGKITGFLGPNGRGKSTTIRSILGLIGYQSGIIKVFGKETGKNKRDMLTNIGYMPSEAMFYPDMTVKQVIKMAADVHKKDCAKERDELCKRLNLDKSRKISDLSLGNRKKVAIVCALQHKPRLLILDEPTGGLDPLIQAEFFSIIKERVAEGATCLLSTHILPEVKNYCDNVVMMREGNVIFTGAVSEIAKTSAKRIKMVRDGVHEDFIYTDDLDQLYKELQGHHITDITIEEPQLEEIFMQYYK